MVCPKIALPFCVHFKGGSCSNTSSLLSSPTLGVDEDDDVEEVDEAEIIESNKKKRKIAMGMLGNKKSWMYIQICTYMHSVSTCVNACIEKKICCLYNKTFPTYFI